MTTILIVLMGAPSLLLTEPHPGSFSWVRVGEHCKMYPCDLDQKSWVGRHYELGLEVILLCDSRSTTLGLGKKQVMGPGERPMGLLT